MQKKQLYIERIRELRSELLDRMANRPVADMGKEGRRL